MADKDFVVKNGIRTVANNFVANSSQVTLTSNVVVDPSATLIANGAAGTLGQYLTSTATGNIYWSSTPAGVNTSAQYAFTNSISFSGNVTIANTISTNTGPGTSGQVLTSSGAGANVRWVTPNYVNLDSTYQYTNNWVFTNTVTFHGALVIDNTITAGGSSGVGTLGQVLVSNGATGAPQWKSVSTSAAGSDMHVQFNDGGTAFGGVSGLAFNKTTSTLTVGTSTVNTTNYTGTSNNSLFLGGTAATNYITTSGTYTITAPHTYNANVSLNTPVAANSSFGTAGQALITAGSAANVYWGSVVTSVSTGTGISASYSGVNPTLSLATVTGVAGTGYTNPTITVDAYGRITSVASGAASSGTVTQVSSGTGLTGGPITTSGTLSLATAGAGVGTYGGSGVSSITLDAYGRVTSVGTATYLTGSGTVLTTSNFTSYYTIPTNTTQLTNGSGYVTSSGSVTSASYTTGGSSGASYNVYCNNLYASADVQAYYSSDINLKENVKPISDALSKTKAIRGVSYDWRQEHIDRISDKEENGFILPKHDVGVIAQEIEKVLPDIVTTRKDGYKAVKYDRLTALLIEAVKELSDKVDSLQSEVKSLRGE